VIEVYFSTGELFGRPRDKDVMIPAQNSRGADLPSSFRVRSTSVVLLAIAIATPRAFSNDATENTAWAAFNRNEAPSQTESYVQPPSKIQELDIYPVSNAPTRPGHKSPVLILVHGGGWGGGSRDALASHARYFASLGWTCVNLSYRLTSMPNVTLMDTQADIRAAFDWVRSRADERKWDADRIVALGESAGGQLACVLGLLPPEAERRRARALVLINPVLDLTQLTWALNQPGLREAGPYNASTSVTHPARLVSPVFHLTGDSPPILLVHGRSDSVVPFSQAEAFAESAKAVGTKVELVALENTNHAFLLQQYGRPETMRSTLRRITKFLEER
jgi:acetyl esterase/lipase